MSKKNRETRAAARATQTDEDFSAAMREKRGEQPLIVVERFGRTIKDRELAEVFMTVERIKGVRRLTQEAWQNEYDAWLKAPRG